MGDITKLLGDVRRGDSQAVSTLFELVYEEILKVARNKMHGERPGHTWRPTELAHETAMRLLARIPDKLGATRAEFFGLAAKAMRSVLVDHARRRGAKKRPSGNGRYQVPFDEMLRLIEQEDRIDILTLDESLEGLRRLNQRQHDIVMLRFFGGLTFKEIADQLGLSVSLIEKEWRFARAWLRRTMSDGKQDNEH